MTAPDQRTLRNAFGAFPTGVTVVTTADADGQRYGFTANSFASLSLDPPLLLVCPGRSLSSFDAFQACGQFAVSVLAEGQEDVSNIFARHKGDRFALVDWTSDALGNPLIAGAAAHFSCRTHNRIDAGDHLILIGEISECSTTPQRGLGYAQGEYFSLGLERAAASAPRQGAKAIAGAIVECNGHILLEDTGAGLRPPEFSLSDRADVRGAVSEHLSRAGLNVTLGKAYSIFDDRRAGTHYTYFIAHTRSDQTGGLGRYVPIAKLPQLRFVSDAHAQMLLRYALEYQTQSFALYVGDEATGDVHPLTDGR